MKVQSQFKIGQSVLVAGFKLNQRIAGVVQTIRKAGVYVKMDDCGQTYIIDPADMIAA